MKLDLVYSLTAMMLGRLFDPPGCATPSLRNQIRQDMKWAMGHIRDAIYFDKDLCRGSTYDCGSSEDENEVIESLGKARVDFGYVVSSYTEFIKETVPKPYNCPVVPTGCDCNRIAGLYADINRIKDGPYDQQFNDFADGKGDCMTLAKSLRQLVIDMICDVDALIAIYKSCQNSCTCTPCTACTTFVTSTVDSTAFVTATTTTTDTEFITLTSEEFTTSTVTVTATSSTCPICPSVTVTETQTQTETETETETKTEIETATETETKTETTTETETTCTETCTSTSCRCCRPTNADGLVVRSNPVANFVARSLRRSQKKGAARRKKLGPSKPKGQLHKKDPSRST